MCRRKVSCEAAVPHILQLERNLRAQIVQYVTAFATQPEKSEHRMSELNATATQKLLNWGIDSCANRHMWQNWSSCEPHSASPRLLPSLDWKLSSFNITIKPCPKSIMLQKFVGPGKQIHACAWAPREDVAETASTASEIEGVHPLSLHCLAATYTCFLAGQKNARSRKHHF